MRKTKPKFARGQRVTLLPFEEEPEQQGTVEIIEATYSEGEVNYMYVVRLDKRFITDSIDDGIREVNDEQMEAL